MVKTSMSTAPPSGDSLPFEVTDVFWMTLKIWDEHRVIVHQGGTSSSKTYSVLQVLFLKCIENKIDVLVAGQDIPNLKEGAYKDFINIWNTNEKTKAYIVDRNKTEMTFEFFNGSKIKFSSFKDSQDAKSGKRDILFVNEANGIPYDVYRQLAIRARHKIIIDYNPSARFWAHTKVLTDPTAKRIISDYRHNKFCSEEIIADILKYKETDPYLWRVYGRGATGQVEGLIFPNVEFISPDKMPAIEDMRHFGYGADYGYAADPNTLVSAGVYQGNIYAKLELYLKGEAGAGVKLPDLAAEWEECITERYYSTISFDNSQSREQADLLRDTYGFNVIAANRRGGSILSGIGLLKDYKMYIVDDEDHHFHEEQQKYLWRRVNGVNKAKPTDSYNHCFHPDTLILTTRGLVKIKEVEIGDFVINSNEKPCMVVNSFLSREDAEIWQYTVNTKVLKSTPDHKVKTPTGWSKIDNLRVGDTVYLEEGGILVESKIKTLSKIKLPNSDVYDLSVYETHEYIAEGLLVSNCWDSLRYWALDNLTNLSGDIPFESEVITF